MKDLYVSLAACLISFTCIPQDDGLIIGEDKDSVQSGTDSAAYEILFDDPYSIKKGFIHIIPVYAELFATNVTAGFGIQSQFYHTHVFDAQVQYRRSYLANTDIYKNAAEKTGNVENPSKSYNYLEAGGTYHIIDMDEIVPAKIFLYDKSLTSDQWAARVADQMEVPAHLRKVIGGRAGGVYYNATTDLNNVMQGQEVTITNNSGEGLPADAVAFTNIQAMGFYVGGSMTWIRNFVIEFPDEREPGGDDLILTTYLDFLMTPAITLDNVIYQGSVYNTSNINTSQIGFRLGIEGKFDRRISWSYGVELGLRPGIRQRGFYALGRISFPVFGTDFESNYQPTRFY